MNKILVNKANICIMEGETEIQCYSYSTLVGIYNKIMNNYILMDSYLDGGIEKSMSKTSRKHQNIFKREYIPANAIEIQSNAIEIQ